MQAGEIREAAGSAAGTGIYSGLPLYELIGILASEGTPLYLSDREELRRLVVYLRPVIGEV
ncbi:hypothetical protein [Streptomyces parvulus]|uniref:hypothetical protein n=1 Tax=Streptomyces parvulus TaxID=146923 RepID=UPI003823F704